MANVSLVRGRGRPAEFSDKSNLVKVLADPDSVSRYLALQLVKKGFLTIEAVKHEGRGRPAHKYVATGKARGYLALAANWGRKTANIRKEVSDMVMV